MKQTTARHGRLHPDGSRDVVVRHQGRLVARVVQLCLVPPGRNPPRRRRRVA